MFPIQQPLDYVGIPTTTGATNSSSLKKSSSSSNKFLARQHRGDDGRRTSNTSTTSASGGSSRTTSGCGIKQHHHDRHLGVEVLMGGHVYHTAANQRDDQQGRGTNNEVEEGGGIEIMKCDELATSDIESCSKVKTSTRKTTCRCSFNPRRSSKDSTYLHESTDSFSSSSYYEDTRHGDYFVDRSKEVLQVKFNKQPHIVDPSVVLSLERTLFAALNNAWLLAIGGIGLMSVGHGDQKATNAGIAILVGAIASALMAFGMHLFRVVQLRKNISFCYSQSVSWASIIALMTLVTLLLELNFGVMYPYLQREKTVTIAGDYSSNNTSLN